MRQSMSTSAQSFKKARVHCLHQSCRVAIGRPGRINKYITYLRSPTGAPAQASVFTISPTLVQPLWANFPSARAHYPERNIERYTLQRHQRGYGLALPTYVVRRGAFPAPRTETSPHGSI